MLNIYFITNLLSLADARDFCCSQVAYTIHVANSWNVQWRYYNAAHCLIWGTIDERIWLKAAQWGTSSARALSEDQLMRTSPAENLVAYYVYFFDNRFFYIV